MTCRTHLKVNVLLTIATWAFHTLPASAHDLPNVHRDLISSIGSERATSGSGNKIVTFRGKTHVVWQDSNDQGYFARIRTLDRSTWEWSTTWSLLKGRDNHSRPNMTIDSKGYLHVVMGGHQQLYYLRSIHPNDASEWTEPVAISTERPNTYAVIVCGPKDALYLTARHDPGWLGMDFYVKPPGKKWEHRGLLVRKQKRYEFYAGYPCSLAWGPDHKTLHMSCGFYMGLWGDGSRKLRGLHQAVGYMRSEDFGKTWTKSDGTLIELPATTDTIDLIDEGIRAREATDQPKPGIRHGGVAVDSQNHPFVVYVHHTPDPGRIFLLTPDGAGGWENRPLQEAIEQRWPGLVAIGCSLSMTRDDLLCLVLTLAPLEHPDANWSPGIWGRPAFWLRDHPNVRRIVRLET